MFSIKNYYKYNHNNNLNIDQSYVIYLWYIDDKCIIS